jgi:hypothetical protein
MIVLRVELWPNGDGLKAKLLGTGIITNTLTGTEENGNYVSKFFTSEGDLCHTGHLENYPRTKGGIWDFVKAAFIKTKKEKPKMIESVENILHNFDLQNKLKRGK